MHKHATDYTKPLLADFEPNNAILESLKTPNILTDFEPNNAVLESLKTPNILTDFERNNAILESLKIPNILTDFERNNAILESLKIPNILTDFERNNAAFEETKEHKANYVETDYNHDLAHRSTEEPNHAIEDYNKVITSAAPNQRQITEAPTSLREKEKASQDIPSQRQTEILEQLESPSEQVKLAPPERKVGRIKSILTTLATVLSAGGGSAEIWSQWGGAIKHFLGILAEIWHQWSGAIKHFFGILAEIWHQWGDAIKHFFGIHE